MAIEDLCVVTVCDHDDKIALVLGFSTWFGVLKVNDLVIVTDYGVKG